MAERHVHKMNSAIEASHPRMGVLWPVLRDLIAVWCARARQRRDLAELEPRLLRDIGLSRADAAMEAAKPFWLP